MRELYVEPTIFLQIATLPKIEPQNRKKTYDTESPIFLFVLQYFQSHASHSGSTQHLFVYFFCKKKKDYLQKKALFVITTNQRFQFS